MISKYRNEDLEVLADSTIAAGMEYSGYIVEGRQGKLGFWHKSIEEYFAATELARRIGQHPGYALKVRENPLLRNLLRLTLSYIESVQADPLRSRNLLEFLVFSNPSNLEEITQSNLLLGVECLKEMRECDADLLNHMYQYSVDGVRKYPYELSIALYKGICEIISTKSIAIQVNQHARSLLRHRIAEVRRYTSLVLCSDPNTWADISLLKEIVKTHPDPQIRVAAAFYLLRSGVTDNFIIDVFAGVSTLELEQIRNSVLENLGEFSLNILKRLCAQLNNMEPNIVQLAQIG